MKKKKYNFKKITDRDLYLVRQIHLCLLAKPRARALKSWPDVKLEYRSLPPPIPKATLNAKPTERIIMLFKSNKRFTEVKKYKPQGKPEHYVEPAALNAIASARIIKLAQPKKQPQKQKKPLSKKQLEKRKKKIKKFKKERDEWIKKRSVRKEVKKPPEAFPKKVWRHSQKLQHLDRLKIISKPAPRHIFKKPVPAKVRQVDSNWPAEASERVKELALPRRIPSETLRNMQYRPWKIPRRCTRAKASERTIQLAVPHPRSQAVDNDLKENPFMISPAALKYKPSRRIIELAVPVTR